MFENCANPSGVDHTNMAPLLAAIEDAGSCVPFQVRFSTQRMSGLSC